jgi:hypothetical protein
MYVNSSRSSIIPELPRFSYNFDDASHFPRSNIDDSIGIPRMEYIFKCSEQEKKEHGMTKLSYQ